ncbi:MAG: YqcC family protein [Bacteroidota bacterium]
MLEKGTIEDLIPALKIEMERAGLWQKSTPAWVNDFDELHLFQTDFAQWLQFVFVPNQLQKNRQNTRMPHALLVPRALKYFGTDLHKGKLLQILIEIDGML